MTGVGEISKIEYLKSRHKKMKFMEKGSQSFFSAFKVIFDMSNIVSKVVYSYYVISRISVNRYEVSDLIIDSFFYQKPIFSLETEYIKSEVYSYSPMVNSVNFYTYEGQLLKREYRFRDKLWCI